VLIQVGASDATEISFPLPLFAFLMLSVPVLLVYLLAMPEIVVGEQVDVKLRGFTVMSFSPSEIVSATVGIVSAREFGGWGIRLTTRKIGFVPSKGPAVKLNLQDGTEVSIRNKDPQAIVRQIEDLVS
jgi:RNA 3'-terminal phosphate cyclase